MKKYRLLVVLGLIALISLPPLDPYFDQFMSAQLLGQVPLLIGLGALLSIGFKGYKLQTSMALAWVVLSFGGVLFWMVPRSLDLAVDSNLIDGLMHLTLVVCGIGLGLSLPAIGPIGQIAAGIYAVAMWSSMGLILRFSQAQICARFTLDQQQSAGLAMLWAGSGLLLVHLLVSITLLVRTGPRTPAKPTHG